jgi:NitT/TauT family transport system substrate-binding protein
MAWSYGQRLIIGLGALLAACAPPATQSGVPAPAAPSAPGANAGQPAATSAPLETIRIGYPSRSMTFLAPILAREKGFYQEQGLNAELQHIATNVGIAALLSKELDYTESIGTNLRSALQGAPITTFLVTSRAPSAVLVARPEYATVDRLRGRIVVVDNPGSSNDQVTRQVLKHYGLDPQSDVQIVSMGDPIVRYQAMEVGQVDAALMPLPFPIVARQNGYQLLVNAPDIVNMPQAGIGTLQTTLESKREQVKRLAKAEIQALRYIRSHPEETSQFISQQFEMELPTATEAHALALPSFSRDGTVERDGIEFLIELEREAAKFAVAPPFEQLVDPSLAADAQKELGLQ